MKAKKTSHSVNPPIVVYHVAGMGDWKEVVDEQLAMLREVGLSKNVRITYLGKELEWLKDRLDIHDVTYTIVRTDENTDHCETFAMAEIDRLAKVENVADPILYLHTKGVSNPGNTSKRDWRKLMEAWVVRRWKVNLSFLNMYDAVGVNWIEGGPQHFSGTFWIATADWIRRLPKFNDYHTTSGQHRYTCELWIGAAQWCKALSLGCKNEPFWNFGYDYNRWLPRHIMLPNRNSIPVTPESSFGDIFTYFNCDKNTDHTYGRVYDTLLPPVDRGKVTSVLELGVYTGSSLQSWELAFPNAQIYGLDTNTNIDYIGMRTRIGICNVIKPKAVQSTMEILGISGPTFDLIVDDGSHKFQDQLASAILMRKYLKPGGTYVIEDIYPYHVAPILAEELKGVVVDRRGVRGRFDDTLVVIGRDSDSLEDLQEPPEFDIPSIFPGDET